ncbi:MAG: DUF460 domain-containing protein [Candidatus Woesearchaeota archaeon]
MADKLLIVGIDPGTTVGFALLDISGRLVCLGSKKHLEVNGLVRETERHGKALIVGCDRKKVPGLIEAFAAKYSATIISPERNLTARAKGRLVKGYRNSRPMNAHEVDALASAVLAFKRVRGLLERVGRFSKLAKRPELLEKVAEEVVKKKVAIKKVLARIV